MPYTIVRRGSEHCVYREINGSSSGRSLGCHDTRREAVRQIAALEASHSKQTQEELDEMYWTLVEEAREEMLQYAEKYLESRSVDSFRNNMRGRIKKLMVSLAILGSDGKFSVDNVEDVGDLEFFIDSVYALLDDFTDNITSYSDNYIRWRATIYANHRHVFVRYGVPRDAAYLLPEFPGISCLGDGWCGCWLLIDETADTWEVYWELNPSKEHCLICIGLADAWSPLTIEKE